MGERLYGLDWLRIGAFGLLILYHVAMVFATWDFHIKSPVLWPAIEGPMLALNPWRLNLLFLVSGVASAFLLTRTTPGRFAWSRTVRLLVPLAVGMILIVPPQPWVELVVKHGYARDYLSFWAQDYFRLGTLHGVALPTWNHLWFVAYLWVYSLLLALAAALIPAGASVALVARGERLLRGPRLLLVPVLMFWLLRLTLYPRFGETHGLINDWYNHAAYGLTFAGGLLLARSSALRDTARALRRPALLLAVAGYIGYLFYYVSHPEGGPEPTVLASSAGRLARTAQSWGAIVALLGFALAWNPGDSAARRYLTEAVFPWYIAHQTLIVLAAFWLRPFGLGNGVLFAALVAITAGGCALFFEMVRRSGPLRSLFGLRSKPLKTHGQSQPVAPI